MANFIWLLHYKFQMYFQTLITCIPLFFAFFASMNYCHSDISRKKRMTGGSTNESAPYAVNILMKNKTQFCTGTIIHKYFILTAAQCIDKEGILLLLDGKEVKPKKTFCHDSFVLGKISKYDIAIIQLDTALTLDNKTSGLLPLSDKPWPKEKKAGEGLECTTVGYGATSMNVTSENQPRSMTVKAIHGDHACGCLRSFQNRRVICLLKDSRALCKGDAGAPLVCNGFGVGIGHARYSSDNCQQTNVGFNGGDCSTMDNVYMYICPHLDWIRKNVPGIPKTPKSCKATKPILEVFLLIICGIANIL